MKRPSQQNPPNQDQNIRSFVSLVSQQTFQSLPRIYGTVKRRIIKNKNRFYQNMKHDYSRLLQNQNQSNKNTSNESKNMGSRHKMEKIHSRNSQDDKKIVGKEQKSADILQFHQKYKKLQFQIHERISKNKLNPLKTHKTKESQSKHKRNLLHKIQINTAMFSPQKDEHSEVDSDNYKSDSRFFHHGQTSKSVPMNNPLMNLYKKRRNEYSNKQKRYDSNSIVEESQQEQGPNHPNHRYYVPKHILKNKDQRFNINRLNIKTEASQLLPQQESLRKPQKVKTQFSKRIIAEKDKYNLFTKQDKYQIPASHEFKKFIESYEPLSPSFSLKGLVKKTSFQIVNYQNACYFGQISEGLKHGNGVLVTQKYIYQGLFQKDQKVKGHQQNFDGVYIGNFKSNSRNGMGKYEWNNGQSYEGGWKDGKKSGFGVWRSPNGDSYEGQWADGRQNGKGTHKHKTSTFKGQFLQSLKHGSGQEIFFNGDKYKGAYARGKPHGFGHYAWVDGSFYEGQFKEGYRDGHGRLSQTNGVSYKGSFKRDFKHGFGQQKLQSGATFEGQFEKGQRVAKQDPEI